MEKKMHAGAIKPLYQKAREFRNNGPHGETVLVGHLKTKPLGFSNEMVEKKSELVVPEIDNFLLKKKNEK